MRQTNKEMLQTNTAQLIYCKEQDKDTGRRPPSMTSNLMLFKLRTSCSATD